jgi:hypothetical protein
MAAQLSWVAFKLGIMWGTACTSVATEGQLFGDLYASHPISRLNHLHCGQTSWPAR